jgi:formylglycine-generating enzyme
LSPVGGPRAPQVAPALSSATQGGVLFRRRLIACGLAGTVLALLSATAAADSARAGVGCPRDMAIVDGSVCVDRWEASLVSVRTNRAVSPYENPGATPVRAVSRAGAVPQAYISKTQAEAACHASHKRLCREAEWMKACQGRTPTKFPYGDERRERYCNDHGVGPLATYYPNTQAAYSSSEAMNDARLNRAPNTVARTGSHRRCKNSYGIFDMVGNVHEWIDDPAGTFRGGYYLDTHQNGDGCSYRTDAHDVSYHDYSTGFRCCKDPT